MHLFLVFTVFLFLLLLLLLLLFFFFFLIFFFFFFFLNAEIQLLWDYYFLKLLSLTPTRWIPAVGNTYVSQSLTWKHYSNNTQGKRCYCRLVLAVSHSTSRSVVTIDWSLCAATSTRNDVEHLNCACTTAGLCGDRERRALCENCIKRDWQRTCYLYCDDANEVVMKRC